MAASLCSDKKMICCVSALALRWPGKKKVRVFLMDGQGAGGFAGEKCMR